MAATAFANEKTAASQLLPTKKRTANSFCQRKTQKT